MKGGKKEKDMRGCYTLALPFLSALRIGFGGGATSQRRRLDNADAVHGHDAIACGASSYAGGEAGRINSVPLPFRQKTLWECKGPEHVS